MMKMQGINRQEEAELPIFKSHEEARDYFEEKYGEKFVFEESSEIGDGICFFYRLITDEEAYIKGASDLNTNGYVGMEFMNSYQPIQIMEDGSTHIVH
ncbi:hypothetical protein HF394_19995 (plasmid) [Planococcus glaciei]|uniref:Uncharacterized protein n=1 Tax=Planococcus glaciei TaxID=459472 RepID=A0A7H8QGT5_9BACL|nr:hypothetical protein [Planococcus glaciei]QDY46946.1 hypothetical protein FK545_20285 [Planococcus glaciei]QKX52812.1 hypothetical protein HF394_19465 [Planococcus glaciei]QKX52911.1 hypothetical protein HF394_19995 [Planococcus glaciei]